VEGGPTKPANDYAFFHRTDPTRPSYISVGMPKTVHISKLKPPLVPPMNVQPDKLQLLISHINENCPPDQRLSRRNVGGHMSRCNTHPTKGTK
jgi:hypothetical protein